MDVTKQECTTTHIDPPFIKGETYDETDKEGVLLLELERLKKLERIPAAEIEEMINALHDLSDLQDTDEYTHLKEREYELVAEVKSLLAVRLGGSDWLVQLEIVDSFSLLRPLDEALREAGVIAGYYPLSGFIGVSSEIYQSLFHHNILKELAFDGYSEGLGIVHHEEIHRVQYYTPEIERKNKDQYARASEDEKQRLDRIAHERDILGEAHADKGQELYSNNLNQLTIEEFIRVLKETGEVLEKRHLSKLIVTQRDIYRLAIAVDEVNRLYALGASDQEIGECVQNALWIEESGIGHYDTIEALLQQRMKERGLNYPEHFKKVYALVEQKDLERQIYIEQVQLAAQHVIKEAYQELVGI